MKSNYFSLREKICQEHLTYYLADNRVRKIITMMVSTTFTYREKKLIYCFFENFCHEWPFFVMNDMKNNQFSFAMRINVPFEPPISFLFSSTIWSNSAWVISFPSVGSTS